MRSKIKRLAQTIGLTYLHTFTYHALDRIKSCTQAKSKMSTRGRKSPSKVTSSAHGASAGPSAPTENVLLLRTLNPYITCPICNGYFVDATTVLDCLHTFCKSCLLKHFEGKEDWLIYSF